MPALAYPPGPQGQRFVGIMPDIRRDILGTLQAAAAYGDLVALPVMGRTVYFANHPDYIKHVLVDNNQNYHKGTALQVARRVIGNGLLTSEDDFHRRQRRLIQPAFHRRRIAAYARVMAEYTADHLAGWQPGQQRDLHHEMMTLTMAIVARCLFDVDVRRDAAEIGAMLEGLFDNLTITDMSPVGMLLEKLPLPRQRRRKYYRAQLDRAIYHFINERRAESDEALSQRDDLLSMILQSVDTEGDGAGMTDTQARDEVMTLFLAGHETTANALSWTFYLLSQQPDAEARLRAELDNVLKGRPPGMDDLPALRYNHMVLAESMRLYPPAWAMSRLALKADLIGGYRIPPGATVLMSQYVMHHHPAYWESPGEFRPERFDPDAQHNRPRYAYFPFGGGPRLCIGEPFAWMEGELLLATIMQRFRLSLAPGAVIEPEPLITLRLKYGLPMVIESV